MHLLFLLRHAKAAWANPGTRDFDRPLTQSGVADAVALGRSMAAAGYAPELVLCSSAKRARDTWERVSGTLCGRRARAIFSDALYGTDAAGYVSLVREAPPAASLLVVGHNPMMEDLAHALPDRGEEEARRAVAGGFPASGLAVIAFSEPLSRLAPGSGFLRAFLAPTPS